MLTRENIRGKIYMRGWEQMRREREREGEGQGKINIRRVCRRTECVDNDGHEGVSQNG